jgi:DNA-binding HxlR family transcriptional regulator
MKKASKQGDWRSICPISSGLDILGDRWSLLIIRDLFENKTRTYSQFLNSPEKISTNILADRLKLLSELEIIEHVEPENSTRNNAYRLTESGKALKPVLLSLGRWSHKYLLDYHPTMISID